jgi:hypothetical protein
MSPLTLAVGCRAMRRSKLLAIAIIIFAVASVYLYFGMRYGDAIDARRPSSDDKYLALSLDELKRDNFQFSQLAGSNLTSVRIAGKLRICYFIYSEKPISINDSDFLYCFDKRTGALLGRM